MSSYITNADIEQRLGTAKAIELTDDEGTGVPNEDRLAEARLGAEGEIDSYLARRCAVPIDLTAWPELAGLLVSVALDLAEYRLYLRKPPIPEDTVRRRTEAVAWLGRAAAGEVVLPSATTLTANPATLEPGGATSPRVFSREQLEDL